MSRSLALLAAAVLAIAALATWAVAQESGDSGIAWQTDIESARVRAASSGRPLMVVFR